MSTTRIKEKISKLVNSQLPEFIQSDYTTFVAFIEAYYEFLEQDQGAQELIQNSRSYSDLDKTTDAFVNYFLKNYASDIPVTVSANKKLLIKRIKDLYESKGSELSFKLLFRLLFNEDVSLSYPFDFVLRASDGRWQQEVSIRVETVEGDRSSLTNRLLRYTFNNVTYETPILRTGELTSTLTEVYIDPNLAAPNYTLGDTIEVYSGSTLLFSGIVRPTTVSARISSVGSGFKRGQVFNINYKSGIGSILRVSNVYANTGISEVKFIDYGYGYPTDESVFVAILDPLKVVSEIESPLGSRIRGFSETGSVLTNNASSSLRYFDTDYVDQNTFYTFTETLASFSSNSITTGTVSSSTPNNYARITITLGSIGRYPGLFTTPNGFLSEPDVRLQDDALYQPFAYQTNSGVDISRFFDVVKQLVHPSGQKLFNNRIISSNIDLFANVTVLPTSNVFTELLDVFDVLDEKTLTIQKQFSDNTITSEALEYTANLFKFDTSNIIESANLSVTKSLSDTSNITEQITVSFLFGREITEQRSLDYFLEEYTLDDEPYADVSGFIMTDSTILSVSKAINNADSTLNITETATAVLQDYFAGSYISEDYVGVQYNLT